MPRQLLRDGRVVADDWIYLTAPETDITIAAAKTAGASGGLIIPFEQWHADKAAWLADPRRLGVVLQPADKVELLSPDLTRFELVAAEFPGPTDGRGYTQARLLRERYGFTHEIRAAGYVRRDQLFFLARCGFNSFELPENELNAASAAFSTFSAEYQPSNDAGLARKLRRR
jgi:uncharacterized protein (DUF934 family)